MTFEKGCIEVTSSWVIKLGEADLWLCFSSEFFKNDLGGSPNNDLGGSPQLLGVELGGSFAS